MHAWEDMKSFAVAMRRKGLGRGEGKVDEVGMAVMSVLIFRLNANKIGGCYE